MCLQGRLVALIAQLAGCSRQSHTQECNPFKTVINKIFGEIKTSLEVIHIHSVRMVSLFDAGIHPNTRTANFLEKFAQALVSCHVGINHNHAFALNGIIQI